MKKVKDNLISIQSVLNIILIIISLILVQANIFLFVFCALIITAYFLFLKAKKIKAYNKIEFWCLFALVLIDILLYAIKKFDIMQNLGTIHEIKNFILSTKQWGIVILIALEVLQVLVLPIPSIFLTLASVSIYGVKTTILVLGITVVLASCVAFLIGKIWGSKAIISIVGEKKYKAYQNVLSKNTKILLPLMFIFPFFPDDLLCLLAGTTSLKFHEFFIISVLTRPIGIIVVSILGDFLIDLLFTMPILMVIFWGIIILIAIRLIVKNKDKIFHSIKKVARKKSNN